MKKSTVNTNFGLFALICVLLVGSVADVFAGGHWGGHGGRFGGARWGGYYNSCNWGVGWGHPYYYGNYYGYPDYGYPYNTVVVETPVVRTTTVVTKVHDTITKDQNEPTANAKPQTQADKKLEIVPGDTSAVNGQTSIGDTATIYVPNSAGRFTPVKLVKHGSGYTGPQGEFYPHSPTVAQLRVLYSY